jgi:hypothetical protein
MMSEGRVSALTTMIGRSLSARSRWQTSRPSMSGSITSSSTTSTVRTPIWTSACDPVAASLTS